ncbi:MAG: 1-acyl-sn-glycerol-3-phosphate acyltransferase [Planctomycetes bacterium]|nr:1-acyl-sn-glycerol-3-phosphate acyltransferase [Planctomycetota bacterium]
MSPLPPRPLDPLWRGLRTLRVVVTVGLYLLVLPSGILPYAVFRVVGACRGWSPVERARRLQRLCAVGLRCMHWWLRVFRIISFDARQVRLQLPPGPCVVVANHPTSLDPTALIVLLGECCTLVKPAVYRQRLIGALLAQAMHFEGPSLDPGSVGNVLDEAMVRLRAGMHLFVFPEGTRSPEGELRPFDRIAFAIACRAGVPVVSLLLRCDPVYLSHATPLYRPPARQPRLVVETLAVDRPEQVGGDSRRLRDLVEGRFRAAVGSGDAHGNAAPPGAGRRWNRPGAGIN